MRPSRVAGQRWRGALAGIGQPPLVVQREMGDASKHLPILPRSQPLAVSAHFVPLFPTTCHYMQTRKDRSTGLWFPNKDLASML